MPSAYIGGEVKLAAGETTKKRGVLKLRPAGNDDEEKSPQQKGDEPFWTPEGSWSP